MSLKTYPGCLFLVLLPTFVWADISGEVVGILDGDTIEVRHNQQTERVRLNGIDCPERGQPYSQRAKQTTAASVFEKKVTLHVLGLDKYGRTIADVLLKDGTHVNQQLVRAGWCWWYRKYAPLDTTLQRLEAEARESKRGLWADPTPIPPWVYRQARRERAQDWIDTDESRVDLAPMLLK